LAGSQTRRAGTEAKWLESPYAPTECQAREQPSEVGIGVVESPRGETACTLRLERGRVARLHLRTGSYANWPVLARAVVDNLLPDFPLINKSFELCYACVDR
jgi:Ni,Fe-hydrogenase III large subunit